MISLRPDKPFLRETRVRRPRPLGVDRPRSRGPRVTTGGTGPIENGETMKDPPASYWGWWGVRRAVDVGVCLEFRVLPRECSRPTAEGTSRVHPTGTEWGSEVRLAD